MRNETDVVPGTRAGTLSSATRPARKANVSDNERLYTSLAGGALALWGLRRRGLFGLLGALAGSGLVARGVSGYCPGYARYGASAEESELAERRGWKTAAVVRREIVIERPRAEVYRFWRDLSNLPRFMPHIERLTVLSDQRSHWVVRAPMGRTVEWDSRITEDRPNERIAWESEASADVRNAGWVEFHEGPGGGSTSVSTTIAYEPPGGQLGRMLARWWGEAPSIQTQDDLQQLKRILESGALAAGVAPAGPEQRPSA